MTGKEMITDFKLRQDFWDCSPETFGYHAQAAEFCAKNNLDPAIIKHTIVMSSVESLIKALNAHCKQAGVEAEEYNFYVSPSARYDKPGELIPVKYRYLIAYAIEGGSEGYYVHCGAITKDGDGYMDFGFCKTYSPDSAYAIAREAQRFLTAAAWN